MSSTFTANDRCDRCGAQAYTEFATSNGFHLLLCAHHFTQHLPALVAKGHTVTRDARKELSTA